MPYMRIIYVVVQGISIVSVESSKPQHKPLAGRLVCQRCPHCVSVLTLRASLAWIAHGLLDSVVDSFFPLVEEIGEHVATIESLVYREDSPASTITAMPFVEPRSLQAPPAAEKAAPSISIVDEKPVFSRDVSSVKTAKTQFSRPRLTCGLMWRRLRRALSQLISSCMRGKPRKVKPSFTRTALGLHRMARTRRLVTSVARVLAPKPEVVAGIRKRLLASHDTATRDDAEVAIYFGDVQGETTENRSLYRMN